MVDQVHDTKEHRFVKAREDLQEEDKAAMEEFFVGARGRKDLSEVQERSNEEGSWDLVNRDENEWRDHDRLPDINLFVQDKPDEEEDKQDEEPFVGGTGPAAAVLPVI